MRAISVIDLKADAAKQVHLLWAACGFRTKRQVNAEQCRKLRSELGSYNSGMRMATVASVRAVDQVHTAHTVVRSTSPLTREVIVEQISRLRQQGLMP